MRSIPIKSYSKHMFELPSMWNLVISTIVFFIAVWYANRFLDGHDIPKGMTRGMLVFLIASIVSYGSGELVDRMQGKKEDPHAAQKSPDDMTQLLKSVQGQQ